MPTLSPQSSLKRFLKFQLLPFCLLLFLCLLLVIGSWGKSAFAKNISVTNNDNFHFSQQVRLGFHSGDDWEPSITSDSLGHIYAMFKHYNVSGGQSCTSCNLRMVFQRSSDNGRTWSQPRALAPIPFKGNSGQDDPQIVVDPVDGRTVWASFIVSYPKAYIAITKSTDFGETWSSPVEVSPQPPNFDKDELSVKGNTVAVAYDDGFNTWISISLDGGKHWAVHEIFPGSNQFYMSLSAGGAIDSHGNLFFSWNSFDKAHSKKGDGPVTLWVSRSTDNGLHWTRTVFGKSGAPIPCHPCGFAYLSAQDAIKIGNDDTVYLLWNSSVNVTNFAPERIYFAKSIDDGLTYSTRVDVSDAHIGVEHCFPALTVGKAAGDVRIGWMDKRTGAWNLFFRKSSDGGDRFGRTIRISGFVQGYPYLTKSGYNLPYGDYFQMTVDQENQTQIAWGEGPDYAGPGNQWTSHSIDD
jgi:hypothetical protein